MSFHYTGYYRRAITEHQQGLKLVLGGTGLGKTSSLAALLREGCLPEDVKLIYVANRVQLLDEMAEQLKDLNLHVQQRQDVDQLRETVADGSLAAFLNLPATRLLIDDYNARGRPFPIRWESLHKRMAKFQRLQRFAEAEMADLVDVPNLTWELLSPLKQLYTFAKRLAQQPPAAGQTLTQREASRLVELQVWPVLFPYLRFQRDPTQRLLLITVQKAFHGVFNGLRTVRLGRWETPPAGERYVFVFDEFDFLENDLLTMLSEDREVSDPFGLVRTFYERISAQKLAHSSYLTQKPSWQAIRDQLTDICNRVDKLKVEHGIDFPDITHFVTNDKEVRGKAIFQSNYSLVTQPLYLRDPSSRANSFDLSTDKSGRSAFVLLDIVSRAVKDIVRLFRRLQSEHEDIYPELLQQCFGRTDYLREIQQVNQIGWQHEWCETNYGYLLTNGFGLYEIETDRSQLTDPDEVAVRYLSMNNSPEAIMREMGRAHLVFGLSATAHIRRTLRNFDWVGLAHPLSPDETFQPLPITVADEADIERANRAKALVRNNTIRFEVAAPPSQSSAFGEQLAAIASRSGDVFGTGSTKEHRLRRIRHFFGLLSHLPPPAAQPTTTPQTHLVFLKSVKQVKYLLGTIRADEDGWFKAVHKPLPNSLTHFELYVVTYRDEATNQSVNCHVVLYDAQFGQSLRKDPALEEHYNALFWDGKPVIVVTTYPSAGNGVNLQYYLTREDYAQQRSAGKRDFEVLHLLDAPYFYFSGTEKEASNATNQAAIKRDMYGIMKLLYAKLISEAQAIGQLHAIRHINRFNKKYLDLPDGILNQMSVFVQALGRIERVWQPMANQLVRLDADVYRVFERFTTQEALAADYQNYRRFASATMQGLLTEVSQYARRHREDLEDELLDIQQANHQAVQVIHRMVRDIVQFRRTGQPADIRKRWQKLREDVLKHNMQADSLREIGGVFRTDYVVGGQLHLNRDCQVAPPGAHSYEFEPWSLNAVYHPLTIIHSTALTNYFRVRGYELSFLDSGTYFVPYVYQSILSGAVGEEATQAILGMRGITASGDTIPDALFEVADLRVEDRPIFIDCKNYGTQTLRQFALPPDDPLHHTTLNESHFRERMVAKWQTLHQALEPANEPCRLLVINLVHDEDGALRYYDADFEPVDTWEQGRIIVLTGALKRQPPDSKDLLTPACLRLFQELHNY
jgi:hypothetical protein